MIYESLCRSQREPRLPSERALLEPLNLDTNWGVASIEKDMEKEPEINDESGDESFSN